MITVTLEPITDQRPVVLMFTDLKASTELKTKLGDVEYALKVTLPHNKLFRDTLCLTPGALENNYTGDGFLATFLRVSDAVNCALCFQHAIRTYQWVHSIGTRIAIHVGESIFLEGVEPGKLEITSHAADICSRLLGVASVGQILLTRHAYDDAHQYVRTHPAISQCDGPLEVHWMAHGRYRFKGKDDDPIEVFEVGAAGLAPFSTPQDSEKGHRVVDQDERDPLGLQPTMGFKPEASLTTSELHADRQSHIFNLIGAAHAERVQERVLQLLQSALEICEIWLRQADDLNVRLVMAQILSELAVEEVTAARRGDRWRQGLNLLDAATKRINDSRLACAYGSCQVI